MPRIVLAGDGESEGGLAIPAPAAAWDAKSAALVIARQRLAETFTELRAPICRYLLALGLDPGQAEEVLQETFLRLCQHLAVDGREANLRGWIFRVAHNLAKDEHRRKRRRPAQSFEDAQGNIDADAHADSRATPEQQLIAQEREGQLIAALERLPTHQQQCLHLRAEGLRYREIAEVLGAGVSTVAEWVQQALRTLGKECDEGK